MSDKAARLANLSSALEQAKTDRTRAEAQVEAAENNTRAALAALQELGVKSPEEAKERIAALTAEIEEALTKAEQELAKAQG